SLRRLSQRMPDFQKRRRAQLRDHLSGADWLGHHTAFPRIAGLEASLRRVVALRRLHERVPGEDRHSPPSPAQPPQRREAEAAPVPGHRSGGAVHHSEPPKDFGSWLPEVGDGLDARIEAFAKNSAELKTEFHVLASRAELPSRLATLAAANDWKRVATHAGA